MRLFDTGEPTATERADRRRINEQNALALFDLPAPAADAHPGGIDPNHGTPLTLEDAAPAKRGPCQYGSR